MALKIFYHRYFFTTVILRLKRYITTATKIIKTDWNGKPLAILNVPDGFKAFCIDENEDILAIVNSQRNEQNEYFDIIRFKQPETAFL